MTYSRDIAIEFAHCDPAGIVFYPRYVEMAQNVVETFFTEELDHPFAKLVAGGGGVPAVSLSFTFRKPSRLGDRLRWTLDVARIGRTSIDFALAADDRLTAGITVVWTEGMAPAPIPDPIRQRLEAHHA
ncbi:acyl-CoA thioesterase (plasmid) [Paracoccus sp. TK19116]|uniref:Acyl-CoA thioesterase n=1 Tax=Paracoccus albicereus TaxID=2922394 RepID=A0ABT1MKL3_9RHOB|nr:thioesterase family protein [Paracoccus albicereus]MCQ0968849.1 acyl-CoA thioesterase [Paracoccus albicereus]